MRVSSDFAGGSVRKSEPHGACFFSEMALLSASKALHIREASNVFANGDSKTKHEQLWICTVITINFCFRRRNIQLCLGYHSRRMPLPASRAPREDSSLNMSEERPSFFLGPCSFAHWHGSSPCPGYAVFCSPHLHCDQGPPQQGLTRHVPATLH